MQISILYFTSTGNTLWLAEKAREIIEAQGHTVRLYEVIKDGEAFIKDKCDIIGIFYPVWCYLPPPPLENFLKEKMPDGNGKKAFFIGNCAGSIANTNMVCKNLMDSKGYDTFYLNHIYMPDNIFIPWLIFNLFTKVPEEQALKKKLADAEQKLYKICSSVIKSEPRLEGISLLNRIMGRIQSKFLPILNFWKKRFSIAKERCVNCGLCIKMCPTGNISKDLNGDLMFGTKCIMCVKCYNLCPKNAVLIVDRSINDKKYKRYKGPTKNFKPVLYTKEM